MPQQWIWVPALRCIVKNAAPRPGHEIHGSIHGSKHPLQPERFERAASSPRQPAGNEFCLHSANHKPGVSRARVERRCLMLRFKILASAIPVIVAAVFAGGGLVPGPHPCIAIDETSVQISYTPWHADLHVAFTDDPTVATVQVQITKSVETADFALFDDADGPEASACE